MKNVLDIMAMLILCAAVSCTEKTTPLESDITVIDHAVLDSATVLVIDSTERRFDDVANACMMLVYKDSILIINSSKQDYGEPILSFYGLGNPLCHFCDYIPYGSDNDEMVACRIQITGDELFVHDSFYTGRYCTIGLRKPLLPANELYLSYSGVEEHGAAAVPFRDGLLVENPQCYVNDEASIHNDVPRRLYYRQGKCLTPQEKVAFQVSEINTGADIHYSPNYQRVCFVSYHQPLVEFYDDTLHLVRSLRVQSEDSQEKIHIAAPHTVMHQTRYRNEFGPSIKATFDKMQRVVGASNEFHAFLCSAADEEHIYLVYCGKMFALNFHAYPSYILVLDWNGNLIDTYCFDRWIQAISPSMKKGVFYLTVFANDDSSSARVKLVKVIPRPIEETDSQINNKQTK